MMHLKKEEAKRALTGAVAIGILIGAAICIITLEVLR